MALACRDSLPSTLLPVPLGKTEVVQEKSSGQARLPVAGAEQLHGVRWGGTGMEGKKNLEQRRGFPRI